MKPLPIIGMKCAENTCLSHDRDYHRVFDAKPVENVAPPYNGVPQREQKK
jgi:hypothetical protein